MVFTFDQIGKRRVGLQDERGQCQLEKIESLPTCVNQQSQTIYTAETKMPTNEGLILGLDDVMQAAPHISDKIQLEFLTPTSIKVNGKWTSEINV